MRKMHENAAAAQMVGPDYGYGYEYYQQQSYQTGNMNWGNGQFAGATGARGLTPAELASGQQAWAYKGGNMNWGNGQFMGPAGPRGLTPADLASGQHAWACKAGNLNWENGQFTGTTGARMLTPAELASGRQAWARKNQLRTAAPVPAGRGMRILQRMGWRPGEGLGKDKKGSLEPIKFDVKFDKKGLVTPEEARLRKSKGQTPLPPGVSHTGGKSVVFTGKHPVTALIELCTKRNWNPPVFDVVFESGPVHDRTFVFKVTVNNTEYQPNLASNKKKEAKALAAQHCLEQLGLIAKTVG